MTIAGPSAPPAGNVDGFGTSAKVNGPGYASSDNWGNIFFTDNTNYIRTLSEYSL